MVFECEICVEDFDQHHRTPKLLRCGHTFCLNCCRRLCDGVQARCPLCQEPFPDGHRSQFVTNFQIVTALVTSSSPVERQDKRRLYVTRIPQWMEERDLMTLFSQYGVVHEVRVVRIALGEDEGGGMRAFAHIGFRDEHGAEQALSCRPIRIAGSKLIVEPALPRANAAVQRHGNCAAPGYPFSHRVFVHNVPRKLGEAELKAAFSEFGAVESVVIRTKRGDTSSFALVTFHFSEAVDKACEKREVRVLNWTLRFRRDRECLRPRPRLPELRSIVLKSERREETREETFVMHNTMICQTALSEDGTARAAGRGGP